MNSTKFSPSSKKTTNGLSRNGDPVSAISEELRLTGIGFSKDKLIARFANGSQVAVHINRYPRLQQANSAQRNDWRLIGKGSGVHWQKLDEDLSVENFLFASSKSSN